MAILPTPVTPHNAHKAQDFLFDLNRIWTEKPNRWSRSYLLVVAFIKEHGHIPPVAAYYDKHMVGLWVFNQMFFDAYLRESRHAVYRFALGMLPGWIWPNDVEKWQAQYEHVAAHACHFGKLPSIIDGNCGTRLIYAARWVDAQRALRSKLEQWQIDALEVLPSWRWISAAAAAE